MSNRVSGGGNNANRPRETNIQVVVRCRPLNNREREEGGTVSLECRRKEVVISTPGDRGTSKTYSFDRVFGTDSKQREVYDEIVAPLLEEVLQGYNCTIFAYGQTGTGKTHTMEGSGIEDAMHNGELDSNAGIIPRVLHNLFKLLDGVESTVKVSQVELFCEELRDLLGPDDGQKLKLFDDAQNKALVIQPLEEVLVATSQDIMQVLQRGSARRKVASTLMNAQSSRSHCVSTITIHMRETSIDGEDTFKIGKLNLVDLAGSENIKRAGLDHSRNSENANINKSLLTLGRVINALVEKAHHIPYRESKLTRLLQDSLGGRTKTCIIATVSPHRGSLEESMSTLDYAFRAKNIRNRPEVNQKVSAKAAIKEAHIEIERLKSDLLASQAKNGIYLTPERYEELNAQLAFQQARLDELKFVQETLDQTKENLKLAVGDISNLHHKIDRKGAVESRNTFHLNEFHRELLEHSQSMESRVGMFIGQQRSDMTQVAHTFDECVSHQDDHLKMVEEGALAAIEEIEKQAAESARAFSAALKDAQDRRGSLASLSEDMAKLHAESGMEMVSKIAASVKSLCEAVHASRETMSAWSRDIRGTIMQSAERVESFASEHSRQMAGMQSAVESGVDSCRRSIKSAEAAVSEMPPAVHQMMADSNEAISRQIASMLAEHMASQKERIDTAVMSATASLRSAEEVCATVDADVQQTVGALAVAVKQTVQDVFEHATRTADQIAEGAEQVVAGIDTALECSTGVTEAAEGGYESVATCMKDVSEAVAGYVKIADEHSTQIEQTQSVSLATLAFKSRDNYTRVTTGLKRVRSEVLEKVNEGKVSLSSGQENLDEMEAMLQGVSGSLRSLTNEYLERKLERDNPTGRTPKRRSYEVKLRDPEEAAAVKPLKL